MMEYPEQKYSEKKIQIDSKGRNFTEKQTEKLCGKISKDPKPKGTEIAQNKQT